MERFSETAIKYCNAWSNILGGSVNHWLKTMFSTKRIISWLILLL